MGSGSSADGRGLTRELTREVTPADTAAAWGDDFPPAASTPFVLGLAEVTCHDAVRDDLGEGEITVGAGAQIAHLAPSPIGARLTARARLTERDGRKLSFEVEILDGQQVVARISHTRAIVRRDTILERLSAT